MEEESVEMDVTIRRQRDQILNLEEQLVEYQLAVDACREDIDKRWSDIEDMETQIELFDTIIEELRTKNQDLEVQLEKAVMLGGPHVNQPISAKKELGQPPHSHVEFSEEEQISEEIEEEKDQEPSSDIAVQIKSWWRRQVRMVVKGIGTFRLSFKSCQGVKSSKAPKARLVSVQPVNSSISSTMNMIAMLPVSEGMPPVSV